MLLEKLVIPVGFDTAGLAAGIDAIEGLIKGAVESTFGWADAMDQLGDATGMSADKLAAWAFVAKKAGVSTDSVSRAMVIMEKGLIKSDGTLDTVGKKMADYGIKVFGANGKLRDQSDLMNDIATRYAKFGTQQERVNFLTDIFGRSGADLVDVFDTLAQEGGIDAVTKKVQDMGLALDPDKYEQFQRSLNEIKLAGTGLAARFTEMLMPALEGALNFVGKFVQLSPSDMLANIGGFLQWLPAKFENWAARIDWGKLSQGIIDWINNIDWAAVGEKVRVGLTQIFNGISTIVQGVDWAGIFSAVGTAFLNFLAGLTGQGNWENVKKTWSDNWSQLKDIVSKVFNGLKDSIAGWIAGVKDKIVTGMQNALNTLIGYVNQMIEAYNSIPLLPDIPLIPTVGGGNGGSNGGPKKRASGGAAGGLTLLGEKGPELVNLPNGSFVNNNQQTQAMTQINYDELGRSVARYLVPALQTAGIG